MGSERIYSENAAFQLLESLKTNRNRRYKTRSFWVEGVRNINQAVESGWDILSFLYSFERRLSPWAAEKLKTVPAKRNIELTAALLNKLSGKDEPSELLAIVRMRDEAPPLPNCGPAPLFVLFDRPSNKGNLGTLLRSCDALGASGLLLTGHAVDIYDPEVIGASMGSFFRVPFLRLSGNEEIDAVFAKLRRQYPGLLLVGTTAHQKLPVWRVDLRGPALFLLGNEHDGLNRRLADHCDLRATIPMSENSSASSLNVSCAATALLYEARRQRETV
ncbi:MAG: hypothetical protein LBD02_07470 [Christensenellaceae bacterium]|jgi:TrmH family RNA methyltransferase|nr:hypothetical protein [Christensenellaceae bacterium]